MRDKWYENVLSFEPKFKRGNECDCKHNDTSFYAHVEHDGEKGDLYFFNYKTKSWRICLRTSNESGDFTSGLIEGYHSDKKMMKWFILFLNRRAAQ